MASSASRITQYGVARSIHTKVRLEASQFARPDPSVRPDSPSHSGDNIGHPERCIPFPQAMPTVRTWQPSNGILFATGHADQGSAKTARRFSSMPERQAPTRDFVADFQPTSADPDAARKHSEMRRLKKDIEDLRSTSQERERESALAIAQLRARVALAESNVRNSDTFKSEMKRQHDEYKEKMKRQQDGHTEEMKRLQDGYRKEMERQRDDATKLLNAKLDELSTLRRDFNSILSDKMNEERAAISRKETGIAEERKKLQQQQANLNAAEQSLRSDRSAFKQYENKLEPLLAKTLENEVAAARASSATRKTRRDTYARLKEVLHTDPAITSFRALTAIEQEITEATGILQSMEASIGDRDHRRQLESYIDELESARSQLSGARDVQSTRLHNGRKVLRSALYPDGGHPASVLQATSSIMQTEYQFALDNLKFANIHDTATRSHFRALVDLGQRLSNYRMQDLLLSEPSEYQIQHRVNPELRLLHFCVKSKEAREFYKDNFTRLVEIIRDHEQLLRREAELIVLRKQIGTWTEQEAGALNREIKTSLENERRGIMDWLARLNLARKSPSQPASRIERPVTGSTRMRLSGAKAKVSARKASSMQPLPVIAPASTNTETRKITPQQREARRERQRRKRARATRTRISREIYLPQYHEAPSNNQPEASPEARPSVDSTSNYAPAVAQASATTVNPASKATLLNNTVTFSPGFRSYSTTTLQRQTKWYSTAQQTPVMASAVIRYPDISQCKLDDSPVINSEMWSRSHRSTHTTVNPQRDDEDWEDFSDRSDSFPTAETPEGLRTASDVASAEAADELDLSDLRLSTSSSDSAESDDCSDDSSSLEDEQSLLPLTYHIPPQKLSDAQAADPESSSAAWSFRLYENAEGEAVALHYYTNFDKAESAAAALLTEPVLGFDLEWEEYSKPGVHDKKRCISLLQLANEKSCHLFHIALFKGSTNADLIPPSLQKLLTSPNIAKAGVNVAGDAGRLKSTFDIEMQGVFELSHMHKLVAYGRDEPSKVNKKQVALAIQVQQHLLLPLPKGEVRTSRWSNKLDMAQSEYAASDAYAGFRLFHALDEKRRNQDPAPPRPAFWELKLPIELADGSLAKSGTRKVVRTTKNDDTDGMVASISQVDENDEFYDAPEYQEDDAAEVEPQQTQAEAQPSKDERVKTVRPVSDELDLANTWIENWMATRPSGSKSGLTAAPLRAYHLWHVQGFDLERTAEIIRQPPILTTTVAGYVADAISRGHLVYDAERLRAALRTLPKSVHGRYKGLIAKLNVGGKD